MLVQNPRRAIVGKTLVSLLSLSDLGPQLYSISCFASLGVFLFGYDQGVMSGILTGPYFQSYFQHPTAFEIATMVSILEIGAFVGCIVVGTIGDIFGRKKTIFWGALIFATGGAIQTFTTGFPLMVFGRVISGFGVGFLSMIVPCYQAEVSPSHSRGALACIEFTGNIIGYATSVWVDYFCSYIPSNLSWRLPLSLQVIIGLILGFGGLLLPESPRWLLDVDQDEDGMRVLADLRGEGDPENEEARDEFRAIKEGVLIERAAGKRTYLKMWKLYKYRVLIAFSSQLFAQLNGINVISYYAPLVFEQAGWIGRDAILMTGINGIIYVLSTVPPIFLVDVWGRRPILLSGAVTMSIALALIGWFMYLNEDYTPVAVVICVVIFNAAFGYSWGPIPWLLPPEIMPQPYRLKGVSVSTAANWSSNWLVGEATPILQEYIGWRLYPMHAFFCATSFVLVYFTYPETRGVPLEAMSELFEDSPLDEQDEDANERVPLTRSRSNSRSRSPDATGRLSVEPPPLNDDLSKSDVLGRLFGQEVRAGSSRKNSFAAEQREDDEDIPRVSAAAGERRGGYQAVAVDDRD